MIGKGKAISHTLASMSYGWNQEKGAQVVFKQDLIGENPNEVAREFKAAQTMNENCQRNTLSFVLSPTIPDGQKLDKKELGKICQEFIEKMKLKDRQAIAFVHQDKQHKHIHLYVNRINFQGKAYNDSFIGKRSQQAAEKVAESLKLETVKHIQMEKLISLKDIRTEIKRRHEVAMKVFKPNTFEKYQEAMKANGVEVIPCINKAKKLQGFRFQFDQYNLKGSEVHRSMSMANIGKQLEICNKLDRDPGTPLLQKVSDKGIDLSGNITAKVAKKVIKKIISKGLDLGM